LDEIHLKSLRAILLRIKSAAELLSLLLGQMHICGGLILCVLTSASQGELSRAVFLGIGELELHTGLSLALPY
jgi:hypothetical protein